jgi:hypothetical protein
MYERLFRKCVLYLRQYQIGSQGIILMTFLLHVRTLSVTYLLSLLCLFLTQFMKHAVFPVSFLEGSLDIFCFIVGYGKVIINIHLQSHRFI